jgi:hypothetical protein
MDARTTELINTRSPFRPKYIYCCSTRQLCMTNLLTGKQSCLQTPVYAFRTGCRWSELPGGSLLITGGWRDFIPTSEVRKVDTLREWAVSSQPPMYTARKAHSAVYHSQYVYVLGGWYYSDFLSEYERYSCARSRWEELDELPLAGEGMSGEAA